MRRLAEARAHLEQDEAPHGLIHGRVFGVVLLHDEAPEVRRNVRVGGGHLEILAPDPRSGSVRPRTARCAST
jgi:hypothetical protein